MKTSWWTLWGSYSNRRNLADTLVSAVRQLRTAQAQTSEPAFSVRSAQSARQWRVGDRLSESDMEQLLAAFAAGASKRKLAERYGISESSAKRLIRQPARGLRFLYIGRRRASTYVESRS